MNYNSESLYLIKKFNNTHTHKIKDYDTNLRYIPILLNLS